MPRTYAAGRSRRKTMSIGWRRPTRHSRITDGKERISFTPRGGRGAWKYMRFGRLGGDIGFGYATERSARADEKYRDCGAYRCGQDHYDRADPLLHRPHAQDRRGA